jgi:LacI family transcriptional regulator
MKIVTIRDVAREAGVSITTVSRVLNERADVDPNTRQRVQQVISRLGYLRNTNAANLKQRHTDFAAIILRGRRNVFLADLAERIMEIGREKGFRFLLEHIDERADIFEAARRLYLERKLSGLIFLGANLKDREEDVRRLDLPCVFTTVDASFMRLKRVASVAVDNFRSGQEAADQLLNRGHRRIALLGYFADRTDSSGMRLNGVLERMRQHKVPFDERLFSDCDFTMEGGWRATQALLDRQVPFTGLIAISDYVAIGAKKALFDRGLSVPRDVSIIGFDGIEQGRYCTPALATLRQPSDEISAVTIQLLGELQRGQTGRHVLLPTQWLTGGSIRSLL